MSKDDGCPALADCSSEDFAGVEWCDIEKSDGHDINKYHSLSGIEHDHNAMLLVLFNLILFYKPFLKNGRNTFWAANLNIAIFENYHLHLHVS